MRFEKHIFICTNQRPPGDRKSCGEACGLELVKEFKKHQVQHFTVVADAAMLSTTNVSALRQAHIHYIVGAR